MKRIAFRIPKSQDRAVIIVDDADAARFRTEYWLARMHKGHLEIYKNVRGCTHMLGRELLGITEDWVCVTHRNEDERDYRRANLLPLSKKTHLKMMNLLNPHSGRYPGFVAEFCKRGHELTDENRMSNGRDGKTTCLICHRMRSKRSYEIRKTLAEMKAVP